MDKIAFTSDTHFGHRLMIEKNLRPFTSIKEMDEYLIKKWNEVVTRNTFIYHLGDFSFASMDRTIEILKQLNGIKFLILGNHDDMMLDKKIAGFFRWIKTYEEIKIFDDIETEPLKHKITLCHYPFEVWNRSHYGQWSLHGHSHGSLKSNQLNNKKRLDIGVDCNNYAPFTYAQIKELMKSKTSETLDHHEYRD